MAADNEDGTLDMAWAKGLVVERLAGIVQAERAAAETAAIREQALADARAELQAEMAAAAAANPAMDADL